VADAAAVVEPVSASHAACQAAIEDDVDQVQSRVRARAGIIGYLSADSVHGIGVRPTDPRPSDLV